MTLKEYRDFGMVCDTEIKKQQEDIVVVKYISLFEGETPVVNNLEDFDLIASDYDTFITKCELSNVLEHNNVNGGNIKEEYPLINSNFKKYYNSKNITNSNNDEEIESGLSKGGKQKILTPAGRPPIHYFEKEGA